MANKTVYPYGTDGSLPSSIGLVNDLKTGGVDKALTAEQGKVIGNLLTEDVPTDLTTRTRYGWYINDTGKWHQSSAHSTSYKCMFISLDSVISFKVTADGGTCTFAFLKSLNMADGVAVDFSAGTSRFGVADGNTAEYPVPADAKYLYIYSNIQAGTDIIGRYEDFTLTYNKLGNTEEVLEEIAVHSVYPHCSYYSLNSSTGEKGGTYYGTSVYTTTRFIKVCGSTIGITVGDTRRVSLYQYDKDFALLERTVVASVVADTETEFSLASGTRYVKVSITISDQLEEGAMTTLLVTGNFPSDWDTFNVRSSDSGYMKVMVPVRVTDPTCCDEETSTVQDASQILKDYGVICLPTQYSNTGKPTRLIIYCHGAAVNYATNVSRFNSVDLEPDYWLAEGYAVMDVEGNPFNNTDEHICIPQAMECYVAAYKWAIEYYNLCRDGIFLGGRSMGGQNTFNLMRRECPIPVIAACPNSSASDASFGYAQKARKEFCALHMGFVVPEGFTWSEGDVTPEEIQVLSDNWDKYIKCCPELSSCIDLPSKEVVLASYPRSNTPTLWSTLHMVAKCPVKLFGCNQDPVPPSTTTALYYRMLMNAGQIAELRLFNSNKDYTGTGTTAHHYDTQDPALRANITTSYGEELTNVPIVYIEMLAFWRRYEQGL